MSPLRSAPPLAMLRALHVSRDRAGLALMLALCSYALVPIALALSPALSVPLMERFHLRSPSFALWWAAQPSPWMYNFENRFLVSELPLSEHELAGAGLPWQAANHQPARAFTFADGRARYLRAPGTHYFYLESRYREHRVRTAYRAHVAASGAVSVAREAQP